MPITPRRLAAALALSLALAPAAAPAAGDSNLAGKLQAAYAGVKSYKLTVLGSVRSNGVFVAPDRYQMTTVLGGKTVKTIFIGKQYWIWSDGKWQKSDTPGNNLDVDITGLLRNARANKSPIQRRADVMRDGKKLGEFEYAFKDGTQETCDFDLRTYLVQRCKSEDITILYSGYNDPTNKVGTPK